jgi:hypothetical protein
MTWGRSGSKVVLVVVGGTVVVVELVVVVEVEVVTGSVELLVEAEVDDDVGGPVVVVAESLQATVSTMTAKEAVQRPLIPQATSSPLGCVTPKDGTEWATLGAGGAGTRPR